MCARISDYTVKIEFSPFLLSVCARTNFDTGMIGNVTFAVRTLSYGSS